MAATAAFLTIGFGRLLHAFTMRDRSSNPVQNIITSNIWVWLSPVFCATAIFVTVHVPGLAETFSFRTPTPDLWSVIAVCAAIPFIVGQIERSVWSRVERRQTPPA